MLRDKNGPKIEVVELAITSPEDIFNERLEQKRKERQEREAQAQKQQAEKMVKPKETKKENLSLGYGIKRTMRLMVGK